MPGSTGVHRTVDLRGLLGALATTESESDSLEAICRWVEERVPGAWCSVLRLDQETGLLHPAAAPTLPPEFVALTRGFPIGPANAACGTAAFTRRLVVCEDIETDPLWAPWAALVLPFGLRSCWSIPVFALDGGVLATFAIYRGQPGGPNESQRLLLEDVARVAAFVIDGDTWEVPSRSGAEPDSWHRQLIEEQGDVTIVCSAAGEVRYASPSVTRILGYPPSGVEQFSLGEFVHPDDWTDAQGWLQQAMTSESGRVAFPVRYRHADGNYRTLDVTASRAAVFGDRPDLILNCRDVTEREAAIRELLASQHYVDRIMSAIPDVLFTWDLQAQRLTFVSASSERVLGYAPEELEGMGSAIMSHMVHPEDVAALQQYVVGWATTSDPGVRTHEFRMAHRNGQWRSFVQREVVQSRDLSGRAATTVGVLQDVTEQRLTERRLREAQHMESLGRLAGGIAHDFNNLLAVILHSAEVMAGQAKDAASDEACTDVLAAARRARDLVQRILTFSRMGETSRQHFSLSDVVHEGLRFFEASKPSSVALVADVTTEPCLLNGDPAQLQQVLLNLCANAEYALRGVTDARLIVALDVRAVDGTDARPDGLAPGRYAVLRVRDNGVGMTDEAMARVFEPFFTTKPQGSGTGLGMAVAHGVVRAHGGTVEVTSRSGHGTAVEVWLPLADEAAPAVRAPDPRRITGEHAAAGPRRILLVDDEPTVARAIGRLLTALGHDVTIETEPLLALDRLRADASAFDVLITDQTMPGMTGDVLARAALQLRADLPVILCSGYSEHYQVEEASRDGIRAFLSKPLDRDALRVLLASLD